MNKKIAKEIVIKWAQVMAQGAGTGVMTHPTEKEREQIFEAIKNLTKHN